MVGAHQQTLGIPGNPAEDWTKKHKLSGGIAQVRCVVASLLVGLCVLTLMLTTLLSVTVWIPVGASFPSLNSVKR